MVGLLEEEYHKLYKRIHQLGQGERPTSYFQSRNSILNVVLLRRAFGNMRAKFGHGAMSSNQVEEHEITYEIAQ